MATQNSINAILTALADGWEMSMGTILRKLKITGADITLTGSGSNTHTFPATSSTLLSNQAAEISALTEKTTLVDDDLFIIEDSAASNAKKKVKKSNVSSGGGGLTNSIASVTTANVTGVVGTRHILDVSGMTANRNFVLPAGTAGDEIEVNISVGDATYALLLIGDTGISINGGSAATEWSRLFITGETIHFVATSTTNWQVVMDGRIPCIAILQRQAAQSCNSGAQTKLALDAAVLNRGEMGDVTTNDRINIRRAGNYQIGAFASLANVFEDQEWLEVEVFKNGALHKFAKQFVSVSVANQYSAPQLTYIDAAALNDYYELYVAHNEGAAQNTDTTYDPTISATEIF